MQKKRLLHEYLLPLELVDAHGHAGRVAGKFEARLKGKPLSSIGIFFLAGKRYLPDGVNEVVFPGTVLLQAVIATSGMGSGGFLGRTMKKTTTAIANP